MKQRYFANKKNSYFLIFSLYTRKMFHNGIKRLHKQVYLIGFHYNLKEAGSQIAGFQRDFYFTGTTVGKI